MKRFVLVCAIISAAASRKLPSSFKTCDKNKSDFNECLADAIPDIIRQLRDKPIRKLALPRMEPLFIPALTISPPKGSSTNNLQQNYTGLNIFGLTNMTCSKADLNFESKIMVMKCQTPQIKIQGNYSFNGTVTVLPIYGKGNATIVLDEVECLHTYQFKEYLKGNRRHFKIISSRLVTTPQNVTYNFENLYNGNQLMADNVIMVMNDNWKEIYSLLGSDYEEAFTIVFRDLFNRVFDRVAIDDIFINS